MKRRELGLLGERIAAVYLQKHGFSIVEQNWRCSSGEIDIIAIEQEVLVFVEVRTRTKYTNQTERFGTVLEAVHPLKQQQIRRLAEIYLYQKRQYERRIRFDVVLVERSNEQMNPIHIRNAF